MADRCDNVVALSGAGRVGKRPPHGGEALQATLGQLDELGCRLQQFWPQSSWSAQQWMIASTPFRMRLAGARKELGELARMGHAGELDSVSWALELNDVRLETERRLQDIEACLHTLQRVETLPAERVQVTAMFAFYKSELLKGLREIRHLIAQRFPAALPEN